MCVVVANLFLLNYTVKAFDMGCDGGTIPKRHELVKGPKKVEKVFFLFFKSVSRLLTLLARGYLSGN